MMSTSVQRMTSDTLRTFSQGKDRKRRIQISANNVLDICFYLWCILQLTFFALMSTMSGIRFNKPVNVKRERQLQKLADATAIITLLLYFVFMTRLAMLLEEGKRKTGETWFQTLTFFSVTIALTSFLWLPQIFWLSRSYRKKQGHRNFIIFACNMSYALICLKLVSLVYGMLASKKQRLQKSQ